MCMFFSKIYKSWKRIQTEKYRKVFDALGPDFLEGMFKRRTLDIGYGPGFFERFLQKKGFDTRNFIAVDIDREMTAQGKDSSQKIIADANMLPFKAESFDSVVCLDALHLINTDFTRVMKKGGFALVSLFFNSQNHREVKRLLKERLKGLRIIREFSYTGRENGFFVLARK